MIIAPPRPSACRSTWAAILTFASLTVAATAQEPLTALNRQLDRVKIVISASGALNNDTSGPNDEYHTVTSDNPSSTVGVLVDLQYIKSPLVGLELNINHARYAQNFTYIPANPGQPNTSYPLSIQNSANEYTFGWVFHTPKVLGIGTFVSAGAGTTDFVPTKGGGLSYQSQARFTYYYNAGLEQQLLSPHFGVRASFRQAFFLAPDFETPFLRDLRHTHTTEPTFGFYLHF
jgi:hypothetical protein